MHKWGGSDEFPALVTVFSAPNYCGSYKNKGAALRLAGGKMAIK